MFVYKVFREICFAKRYNPTQKVDYYSLYFKQDGMEAKKEYPGVCTGVAVEWSFICNFFY